MRINISGFSSNHYSGSNTKNVINFSNLIKDILNDNGHIADYQLENADLNIVFIVDLASPNTKYYEHALKLLQTEDCIIALDDWSIKNMYKTFDKYLNGTKIFKTHFHIEQVVINKYRDVIEKIANGEYKVLYPAYKTGNHELLEIRGDKYFIDPSIYVKKERASQFEMFVNELLPVHASLAAKSLDKKYTVLNVRNESEDKVFEYYVKHRIVLSPEHYFTNQAGWFRNRYSLAHLADAVIIEDENSPFGIEYAISRKEVTPASIEKLLYMQKYSYNKVIMTKEEINERLKEII